MSSDLPFHAAETSENRILIIKSCNNMYNRLLQLRQVDSGTNRGVVLTGQPGTGVSIMTRFTPRATTTVGKVSTDKPVQNFSRYWVVLSTFSTDAF